MEVVNTKDMTSLFDFCSKYTFRAKENDRQTLYIQKKCEDLFAKDYVFSLINNVQGSLSNTYPSAIILPEQTITSGAETNNRARNGPDGVSDSVRLRDLIQKAKVARCRARFPVPVILLDGKYVCRSATLSGGPEIYGRSGYEFLFAGSNDITDEDDEGLSSEALPQSSGEWQLFTKVRNQDIRLLRMLSVDFICDLMVEKKKVKFGMNVTSSEKVDKENRYSEFTILSLPYPGCEFFREYRDNEYNAEGLVFDWSQGYVDVQLVVPQDSISSQLDTDWVKYKTWDIVTLTQNYLRLLLKYLLEGQSGLLVHCISGWDRTPLFVSLLRLSLWADGRIHASLSPMEIAYLTVAYDWFLFGHNLPDRLSKGEEIFFFCFYMLKHLDSEEFSAQVLKSSREKRHNSESHFDGILLEDEPARTLGSNTSLNSSSSSLSSRSQDNPPTVFSVADSGDENCLGNGNYMCPHGNVVPWTEPVIRTPPTLSNSSECCTNSHSNIMVSNPTSQIKGPCCGPVTSPVAVPASLRHRSQSSSSVCCGSWQIINGTGSVRSSASARESLNSPVTWELNHNSPSTKSSQHTQEQQAPGRLS
ncbi:myotubularin-related protein 14-like isoform X2 [Ornithodoros turicata]|uniref:myotubularin-related protein 14-like isoform X2 n=1 Tax=Ornithodoros turicata TaxID=34597 RepID=UPI003139846F